MSWALERWQLSTGAVLVTALGGLVVGLGAVAGPAILLAGAIGLLLTALTLFDLRLGIALITVLTFFESLATFGGGVTFVKLAGAVVILSWLMLAANRGTQMRLLFLDQPVFTYSILLFVGWATASVLWAVDSAATTSYVTRLWLVVALLFVTYSAMREPKHIRLILWAFVVGALGTTLYGLGTGLVAKDDRLIGGISNPNDLAAALVPAVVLAGTLAATARGGAERVLALGSASLFLVALFLTGSRGGLVGLAVGLLVALGIGGALRRYVVLLLLLVVSAGVVHFAFVATPEERTRFTELSAEGSSGRTDAWNVGLRVWHDNPVTGVGLDNFGLVEPQYATGDFGIFEIRLILKRVVPHNVYVQLLAELGVVGALAYLSVVAGALVLGLLAIKRLAALGDWRTELLGRGLLIALVSLLAIFFFHNGLVQKEFWLLAGMLVSLTAFAARAEQEVAVASAPTTDRAAPVAVS